MKQSDRLAEIGNELMNMVVHEIDPGIELAAEDPEGFDSEEWLEAEREELREERRRVKKALREEA